MEKNKNKLYAEEFNLLPYLPEDLIEAGKIFDVIRKKRLVVQPEELVRQAFIHYLRKKLKFSQSRIGLEQEIKVGKLRKRIDLALYAPQGDMLLLVECKSWKVKLTHETIKQIAIYNSAQNAPQLLIINGLEAVYLKKSNHLWKQAQIKTLGKTF